MATDYFAVATWSLKRLYVLFFMELGTRRILWFGVTENPNQEWVGQQARNLTWELQEQGSQANAYAERWVGSARRECLDWLIIGAISPRAGAGRVRRPLQQ